MAVLYEQNFVSTGRNESRQKVLGSEGVEILDSGSEGVKWLGL